MQSTWSILENLLKLNTPTGHNAAPLHSLSVYIVSGQKRIKLNMYLVFQRVFLKLYYQKLMQSHRIKVFTTPQILMPSRVGYVRPGQWLLFFAYSLSLTHSLSSSRSVRHFVLLLPLIYYYYFVILFSN